MRALYEDSAVPVREIAGVAGVTERTIYKYVAKLGWKRRYRCAPEKGAGGRFIRREDKGLPFAQGLKATDPAGAQRAVVACGEAERLSREAQAEADEQQRVEARIQAMEWTCRASSQLRAYLDARDQQQQPGGPAPGNDPLERMYRLGLTMELSRWEAMLAEEGGRGSSFFCHSGLACCARAPE